MIKRTWHTDRDVTPAASCMEKKDRECQLVDFVGADGRCDSFPLAQLVRCTLEPNPAPEDATDAPPDRLTLVFATQDVVLLGWHLQAILDALDLSRPVAVRVRDPRYAKVDDRQSFVSALSIHNGE